MKFIVKQYETHVRSCEVEADETRGMPEDWFPELRDLGDGEIIPSIAEVKVAK